MKPQVSLILVLALLAATLGLAGCGAKAEARMAPLSDLPHEMQQAPASVRTAYQFAVANPDALANVPCYCGCGAIGHDSNLACYIKGKGNDGKFVFDDHALGCSICVDIALDVKKLTEEGKDPSAIHTQIVDTYSKFGPSNQ